jgi:hypothetical protein
VISGTVRVSGAANGTLKVSRRGTVTGVLGGVACASGPRARSGGDACATGGTLWPERFVAYAPSCRRAVSADLRAR